MEIEIISRECIKPSSPTPLPLQTHKLSFLDQFRHHDYFPVFLYYSVNHETNLISPATRLQLLKQSLSETLVRFYPFAGILKDKFSVECNDEGIHFIEARVKTRLNEFLSQPEISLISKFLPAYEDSDHVAVIQVTTFACGGLVICACLSHLFGDGATLSSFLKSWANNNTDAAICPNNDASNLFPQNNDACSMLAATQFFKTGRFVTRRFLFDAKAIDTLKAKATSSWVQNPTRVEAVTALVCKCIMAAAASSKAKSGSLKPMLLTHLVNLRRKARPPLAEHSMGNIIWTANALCRDDELELDGLVCKLRKAIMKINGDFVKSLQGDGGFLNFCDAIKDEIGLCANAADRIRCTSWCNFGFYDLDFGWGKPIWVSSAGLEEKFTKFANFIILMDTRLGDGVEAWVYLLQDEMSLLELDKELLGFATLDPSPLWQC